MLLLETWGRLLINSFVPMSLVPLVYWRQTARFALENKFMVVLVVLVFFSTWFSGSSERLMSPASVVFYLLIEPVP
jgi:hypothetical protein